MKKRQKIKRVVKITLLYMRKDICTYFAIPLIILLLPFAIVTEDNVAKYSEFFLVILAIFMYIKRIYTKSRAIQKLTNEIVPLKIKIISRWIIKLLLWAAIAFMIFLNLLGN